MLEPDTRELLLDLLRPPPGTTLDQAVGTTFTLDLSALLVAPLAFAMFDWAVQEDGEPDPIAMLEALRRYADRTTVFHQAGMVALPSWQPLLVHLEHCVVAVTPPRPHSIFHPKLWVLRFIDDDGSPSYRLVVLSRNLTFDTSWDTVVVLEGHGRGQSQIGEEVGGFLGALLDQGAPITPARRQAIAEMAEDIRDVVFDPPEDVDTVALHTFGFGPSELPFPSHPERAVVISPFLGADAVVEALRGADERTLVSRPESLDALPVNALDGITARVLADGVVDDDTARATGRVHLTNDDDHRDDLVLRGLHAKIFAYEQNGTTDLFTGSANATGAAFGGNVEVLVQLTGRRDRFNLTSLLDAGDGDATFGSMLVDHAPTQDEHDDTSERLERELDRARREIGRLRFTATVQEAGDDFAIRLITDRLPDLPESIVDVRIWRLSLGQGHAHSVIEHDGHWAIDYPRVDLRGMSAFFAIELLAEVSGRQDRAQMAVTAELVGAPPSRVEDAITHILQDSDQVVRYLLFLLADSGAEAADQLTALASQSGNGDGGGGMFGAAPLLETLLSALSRDPRKLDHVGRLVEDLRRNGSADELLPEGLEQLWDAIAAARDELER